MLRPIKYKWRTIKPKSPGRPKSEQKPKPRLKFGQTRLGKQIALNAPLEFSLVVEMCGINYPTADFIEAISYASKNPYFRTLEFRYLLIDFREKGLRPLRAVKEAPVEAKEKAMKERREAMKRAARKNVKKMRE